MLKKEPIRLVIWDLDETFWKGTLTEGGIREYIHDNHHIVMELARRGIVSSICSKNDFNLVEKILKEQEIWDHFILPSIDWSSKGPRIKNLIYDIQLRPETVLFIDDNASNRAEAAAHVPGLQIADESIIPTLLTNELLKGKDDPGLSRLKQYQLLQRRKIDEKAAGIDNIAFLRTSNIRVIIEPNVMAHLDRAIELINRTNQLNFTKRRLPEDQALAQTELTKVINRYCIQAGLVRVIDNYGDYGFCGIYAIFTRHDVKQIMYFCFSCRILGMNVERWLYQKLGRPPLQISEEEVIPHHFSEENIDWINQEINGELIFAEGDGSSPLINNSSKKKRVPEIRLRGGCELDALSHYLEQDTETLISHTNYPYGAFLRRQDTTTSIALSLRPFDNIIKKELDALALDHKDFDGQIFLSPQSGTLFVLSTWGDLYLPRYRHRTLELEVEVAMHFPGLHDLTKISSENLENFFTHNESAVKYFSEEKKEQVRQVVKHLSENYVYLGITDQESLRRNCTKIFSQIPKNCMAVVLLPNSQRGSDTIVAIHYHAIVRDVAKNFPQIHIIDVTKYVTKKEDLQDAVDHFDRMVYFKVYKDLVHEYGRRHNAHGLEEKVVA